MNALIVLLLILVNGLFAMAEIAVVSANKMRLQQKAEAGNKAAQRAFALTQNPNVFLSTVQIGITLVGVFNGAFGAATLSEPVARLLARVSWLEGIAEPLALVMLVVLITYLSLVVGELVPKRIGLGNPEGVAMAVAAPMGFIARITRPLVSFLGASTNLVLRLLRVRTADEEAISEEEIDMVIAQGLRAGVIEPAEQEIIENAFWLGERRVNAIMTPRHEVAWLDTEDSSAELLRIVRDRPHGRYLVCEGDIDKVVGYVSIRDLLAVLLAGEALQLRTVLRKPLLVPETMPILTLLEEFQRSTVHIAVVLDEYGGVEGIVTLTDILEELVGSSIPDGDDSAAEVVKLGDEHWRFSGGIHIDDVLRVLDLDEDTLPAERGYHTLGGFMAERLGRVPQAQDEVFWAGFCFRVAAMDSLRVDAVEVHRAPEEVIEELGEASAEEGD